MDDPPPLRTLTPIVNYTVNLFSLFGIYMLRFWICHRIRPFLFRFSRLSLDPMAYVLTDVRGFVLDTRV